MTIHRSQMYEDIRERVYDSYGQYSPPDEDEMSKEWRKGIGGRWRNRVGLPRLTAQEAAFEATALLNSINASVFRSEPVMAIQLQAAREAAAEFARAVGVDNWERFEGSADAS